MIFYSASTGGFYHRDLHRDAIPADAVEIGERRHRELLDAQAEGRQIVANDAGRPILAPIDDSVARRRSQALASLRREARRRILAVASLEQQSNDNAALALAVIDHAEAPADAIDRRRRIDAIRSAHASATHRIDALHADDLDAFDAGDAALWPKEG